MGDIQLNLLNFFRRLSGKDEYVKTPTIPYYSSTLTDTKEAFVSITNQEFNLYRTTAELSVVVNKDAELLSNGIYAILNSKGEEIENHPLLELLNNPNPLQSKSDFIRESQIMMDVFGNRFILKNKGSLSKYPTTLVNLPCFGMKIHKKGKIYRMTSIDEIIEKYELFLNGSTIDNFQPSEIIHSRIINPEDPIVGLSPLHAIQMPLSNIRAAYGFRNVILTKKGALGILSGGGKGVSGNGIPLGETERKEIQKQLTNDYGIYEDQHKFHIASTPMQWQPMTFPTKDLMLFEEIDADLKRIIDNYGHNESIYSTANSAKFDNMDSGLKMTYQDRVIPQANSFCHDLTKGLCQPGERIVLKYDHLPIMKENEVEKSNVLARKANGVQYLVNSGVALDEALIMMDISVK